MWIGDKADAEVRQLAAERREHKHPEHAQAACPRRASWINVPSQRKDPLSTSRYVSI